jgi:hypothetical protein
MSKNTVDRDIVSPHTPHRNAVRFLIHVVRSVQVKRMALHAMTTLQVGLVFAVASVLAYPTSVQALLISNTYVEVGDAGDLNSPQFITGGPYDGIGGGIDDTVDVDVFAFHWIGGDFVAKFFSGSDPTIALYDFSQNSLGSASGLAPVLTINNVTAGNYLFEISTVAGSDLGYVVGISSSTNNPLPISAPTVVPEPATLTLMVLGLAGLGISMRRRVASIFESPIGKVCVPFMG